METTPNDNKNLKTEFKSKEVANGGKGAWDEIQNSIWSLIFTGGITLIGAVVFTLLEKAGGIYFWVLFVSILTIFVQWGTTATIFNVKEKSLWKIILLVLLAIVWGHITIFSTTAILKIYGINKEVYIPVFFGVMVLMAIPPIWYIRSHAKKSLKEAKYAYELIKPVVNSFALVSTIYIFTARYFPNELASETMPGFILNPKTLPFYCYPWVLAFTFGEYYIKKKYPEKKDETKEDEAT